MKTHQDRLRTGIRWWMLRKMWLKGSQVSRWACQQMIKLSQKADKRDCEDSDKK